ncbi:hypothetical protein [Mycobacterium sp. RTGN5]|uniref:hypothetical protein n=1 Tax=Mycobacterium sp. RTGN5 TaxID=3016522 RepID=UPI0029C7031C|nr:hypothetical protein [Mycobacterium sp. RTGN5]
MLSSKAPAGADEEADAEVVVGAAELDGAADVEDDAWLEVDSEDESLLEHPAAITERATMPAIQNR